MMTPVLAEAAARKPRKTPRKTQNNYVAEAAPKQRAGAKQGNRNAMRDGKHSAAAIARRRRERLKARKLKILLAWGADLMRLGMDPDADLLPLAAVDPGSQFSKLYTRALKRSSHEP